MSPTPNGHNWQGWILDAIERAAKTAAQSALLAVGVVTAGNVADGVPLLNAFELPWWDMLGYALGGGALSLLTSVASKPVGDGESASLVKR